MAHRNRWLAVLKNCVPWRCEITRGHQKLYFSHPPTELFYCCCMFLPHCFALIFLFRFHPATSGGYAMRVPSPQNCRIWALAEFILPVGSGKTFHCTPGQNKQPTLDWTPRSNGGISWYMFWKKTCLTVLIELKQTQFTDVFNAFAAKHKLNIQAIFAPLCHLPNLQWADGSRSATTNLIRNSRSESTLASRAYLDRSEVAVAEKYGEVERSWKKLDMGWAMLGFYGSIFAGQNRPAKNSMCAAYPM